MDRKFNKCLTEGSLPHTPAIVVVVVVVPIPVAIALVEDEPVVVDRSAACKKCLSLYPV